MLSFAFCPHGLFRQSLFGERDDDQGIGGGIPKRAEWIPDGLSALWVQSVWRIVGASGLQPSIRTTPRLRSALPILDDALR